MLRMAWATAIARGRALRIGPMRLGGEAPEFSACRQSLGTSALGRSRFRVAAWLRSKTLRPGHHWYRNADLQGIAGQRINARLVELP